MIIYKITNIQTQQVYIGQTINSLEDRIKRHKNDALNNIIDTHFARAIRYYGWDSFQYEIIETATTQDELNQKEQYWIRFYNSVKEGYNETDAISKCGGNTYQSKTAEEVEIIKDKIRQSKLGGKNPAATAVKCKNIETNEEYHFGSQAEVRDFFKETNHQFVSRRCLGTIKCLYQNKWLFAYEENDYPTDYTFKGQTKKTGTQIKIIDKHTKEEFIFKSIRHAKESSLSLPSREMISKILHGEREQRDDYHIEYL